MVEKTFPWKPTFNKVIITLNTEQIGHDLVLSDATMSEIQTVMAKGSHVHEIEVGDKVLIDINKLISKTTSQRDTHDTIATIQIDPVVVDDITYALIEDRFIKAIYKGEE